MSEPTDPVDGFVEDTQELLECAKANLEQMPKFRPGVERDPGYMIAMKQLKAAIARYDREG